jgi:hypothetical protein
VAARPGRRPGHALRKDVVQVTQLGWPGKVGCAVAAATARGGTRLECLALNEMTLDVTVLKPAAVELGLGRIVALYHRASFPSHIH